MHVLALPTSTDLHRCKKRETNVVLIRRFWKSPSVFRTTLLQSWSPNGLEYRRPVLSPEPSEKRTLGHAKKFVGR